MARMDIVITQKQTFSFRFAAQFPGASDAEIADGRGIADMAAQGFLSARLAIRPEGADAPVVNVTTASGHIVMLHENDGDPQTPRWWSGYIRLPPSYTATLTPWGRAPWTLEFYAPDETFELLWGYAELRETTNP